MPFTTGFASYLGAGTEVLLGPAGYCCACGGLLVTLLLVELLAGPFGMNEVIMGLASIAVQKFAKKNV